MKAIILAAGEGKRLQPLTNDKPKCLVELFGQSLLEHQINIFKNCNIDDISVVTGYKNELINFKNVHYYQNPNYQITNMVETLFCAESSLKNNVIISYGDIIFEKKVLKKLIESKNDISIIIDLNWKKYWNERFDNPLNDAESLVLDNDSFIRDIGQKISNYENIQGQYIGLMKFQNEGINALHSFYKKSKFNSTKKNVLNPNLPFSQSYMTDLLQGMIHSGYKIKGIPISGGWLELDSLNDYELYNKKYSNGTLSDFITLKK
jgi:L-glutamine-phosphate cytidylyltransferase